MVRTKCVNLIHTDETHHKNKIVSTKKKSYAQLGLLYTQVFKTCTFAFFFPAQLTFFLTLVSQFKD